MTPERWQLIDRLYHAALDHAPEERPRFLARMCAEDSDLLRELESLLASNASAVGFLDESALETEARAARPLAPGTRVGRYEVISLIDSGAMSVVYLACDLQLGRRVALKMLQPESMSDERRRARFVREARAASALDHPNIITIYEVGEAEGTLFIATEFVEGVALRERLEAGKLEIPEALSIARQVGAALDAAHRAGIVHRDIKPENIMLRPDGFVKVLDFGLARRFQPRPGTEAPSRRITRTGEVLGTPRYMAPEQARGLSVDTRADVFSFGLVLFEMVSGRPAFPGKNYARVLRALLNERVPSLDDIPPALNALIQRCTEPEPERRYVWAREMLDDLLKIR